MKKLSECNVLFPRHHHAGPSRAHLLSPVAGFLFFIVLTAVITTTAADAAPDCTGWTVFNGYPMLTNGYHFQAVQCTLRNPAGTVGAQIPAGPRTLVTRITVTDSVCDSVTALRIQGSTNAALEATQPAVFVVVTRTAFTQGFLSIAGAFAPHSRVDVTGNVFTITNANSPVASNLGCIHFYAPSHSAPVTLHVNSTVRIDTNNITATFSSSSYIFNPMDITIFQDAGYSISNNRIQLTCPSSTCWVLHTLPPTSDVVPVLMSNRSFITIDGNIVSGTVNGGRCFAPHWQRLDITAGIVNVSISYSQNTVVWASTTGGPEGFTMPNLNVVNAFGVVYAIVGNNITFTSVANVYEACLVVMTSGCCAMNNIVRYTAPTPPAYASRFLLRIELNNVTVRASALASLAGVLLHFNGGNANPFDGIVSLAHNMIVRPSGTLLRLVLMSSFRSTYSAASPLGPSVVVAVNNTLAGNAPSAVVFEGLGSVIFGGSATPPAALTPATAVRPFLACQNTLQTAPSTVLAAALPLASWATQFATPWTTASRACVVSKSVALTPSKNSSVSGSSNVSASISDSTPALPTVTRTLTRSQIAATITPTHNQQPTTTTASSPAPLSTTTTAPLTTTSTPMPATGAPTSTAPGTSSSTGASVFTTAVISTNTGATTVPSTSPSSTSPSSTSPSSTSPSSTSPSSTSPSSTSPSSTSPSSTSPSSPSDNVSSTTADVSTTTTAAAASTSAATALHTTTATSCVGSDPTAVLATAIFSATALSTTPVPADTLSGLGIDVTLPVELLKSGGGMPSTDSGEIRLLPPGASACSINTTTGTTGAVIRDACASSSDPFWISYLQATTTSPPPSPSPTGPTDPTTAVTAVSVTCHALTASVLRCVLPPVPPTAVAALSWLREDAAEEGAAFVAFALPQSMLAANNSTPLNTSCIGPLVEVTIRLGVRRLSSSSSGGLQVATVTVVLAAGAGADALLLLADPTACQSLALAALYLGGCGTAADVHAARIARFLLSPAITAGPAVVVALHVGFVLILVAAHTVALRACKIENGPPTTTAAATTANIPATATPSSVLLGVTTMTAVLLFPGVAWATARLAATAVGVAEVLALVAGTIFLVAVPAGCAWLLIRRLDSAAVAALRRDLRHPTALWRLLLPAERWPLVWRGERRGWADGHVTLLTMDMHLDIEMTDEVDEDIIAGARKKADRGVVPATTDSSAVLPAAHTAAFRRRLAVLVATAGVQGQARFPCRLMPCVAVALFVSWCALVVAPTPRSASSSEFGTAENRSFYPGRACIGTSAAAAAVALVAALATLVSRPYRSLFTTVLSVPALVLVAFVALAHALHLHHAAADPPQNGPSTTTQSWGTAKAIGALLVAVLSAARSVYAGGVLYWEWRQVDYQQ